MSAGKLPEGWVLSTIGEVCDLNPKHKHADDLDVGFMPMAGVPTDYLGICSHETRKWKDVKKGFTQFANNDVIFAKITPCFENGKAAVINNFPSGYGAGSTEYFVLRSVGNLVHPYWFLALVKTKDFLISGALNMSGSVGHKRVPKEFVEKYKLPIPPLAEQKIIAEKLDTLLAQVDSAKARLEQIPQILKRFRQSVLFAAVSGSLTKAWRKGEEYIYNSLELGKLANFIDYRGKTPTKTDSGVPLITAKNIRQGYISQEPREYISEADYDKWMTRGIPNIGDILITTEAPMGYVANINIEGKFALAQRAICLQFKESINSFFASIYMQSSIFQQQLNENATGSTVKGIKASLLKKIAITYPSLSEQHEIVRRVEQLFTYADSIEKQVNNALARVNNLTQSILAKAFRGELTAQWRAENPELISGENSAAALLEKIKAERAASGGKKASRKKV